MHSVSTPGLSVYRFQIPIQWQTCCQKLTTLGYFAESTSFQKPKQRSGKKAQHLEKKTPEEKLQKTFVELLPKD